MITKLQTFWISNKFNASRKYKPSVLQSMLQHASWRTKIPAVAVMGRPYRLYLKAGVRLPVAKRWQFSRVTAVPYRSGDVAILDAKISARIRYGNLAHVSQVSDGCSYS